MCLYPKLITNRKYVSTKKNGGNIPQVKDPRVLKVPVGCGKCIECRKQKSRAWQVRLNEEIRTAKEAQFVTLTLSDESYAALSKEIEGAEGYTLDNAIATLAVRRFLERWRKHHNTKRRKSNASVATNSVVSQCKHWLITELGHNGTENIHLHGIIFNNNKQLIEERWGYGFVYFGDYVNEQTVNYIIKYFTKTDPQHPQYVPKILTSPGIGDQYLKRIDAQRNKYNGENTNERYQTRTGLKLNLPIYYRNKIYSEEEREQLWLQKQDKGIRYVLGQKMRSDKEYESAVKTARAKNQILGYGNDEKDWDKIQYENELRRQKQETRIQRAQKGVGS